MPFRRLNSLASLLLTLAAGTVSAQDTHYWNPAGSTENQGGSGTLDSSTPLWNTSSTPSGILVVWTNGNHAVFAGSGGTITSNDASLVTGNVSFRNSAYTLNGGLNLDITGNLTVESLGSLTTTGALTINADLALYNGTFNVNGGSFSTSTNGYIGVDGSSNGRLNISDGGSAGFLNTSIGTLASSYGFITVDGADSTLTISGNHYVGQGGYGELTITNGATATASNAYLGYDSSGTGYVTVSGTGSTWTVSNLFSFARGTVAVTDGGHVVLPSEVSLGANATLSIGRDDSAAGTIQASAVSSAYLTSQVIFDHNESDYVFSPSLSWAISVAHIGSGTTTLNSDNSYAGGTTLTNGTLRLGINQALGHYSGDLTLDGGTLDLNGYAQTSDLLYVTATSTINFSGDSTLILNDSSILEWTGLLILLNFGAGDTFRVGTHAGGLTAQQLSMIHIGGFYAQIDSFGYISASATAVPEPSTYAALAGLLALGFAFWRKRRC